jgi:WD40 repeat protein
MARVWDSVTGSEIAMLRGQQDVFRGHQDNVVCAAFSTDEARAVTASWDSTVRIWDIDTGAETVSLKGQVLPSSVCFSLDGARILTAGAGTARIWDVATAREIARLEAQWIRSAVFRPDGFGVLTLGDGLGVLSTYADNRGGAIAISDVRLAMMSIHELLNEVCTYRLRGIGKMTRDEMRLAGYPDEMPEIDVCEATERKSARVPRSNSPQKTRAVSRPTPL